MASRPLWPLVACAGPDHYKALEHTYSKSDSVRSSEDLNPSLIQQSTF